MYIVYNVIKDNYMIYNILQNIIIFTNIVYTVNSIMNTCIKKSCRSNKL